MPSNIPGYLTPTSSQPLPGPLSLEDFIQSVIKGISGFAGTLVRPKWQQNPPKQPGIDINWIAFGLVNNAPDANASVTMDDAGVTKLKRQELLEIQVAFYGPAAQENISVFRDGFQIQQNLEAMMLANMGFKECSQAIRGPDLVNERWVERYEMSLFLVRQVQRTYPILSFASASGVIHTVLETPEDIDWETQEPPP
ncbi:hypothetical protein UFOVP558_11 [uncultured Caudovirales phage]|uniref:Phage neck terminator protein gp12-like domain-containing protein n=1 Tax=uncultured Caudovirales phage TaxID=2100421 RepID=A0A6J5MXA0_9CAUD|nr:hypothetical protein UFOVP558_11 [uncultured Caudovirales phage]